MKSFKKISVLIIVLMLVVSCNVYGSSSIAVSNSSPTVGDNITVTVRVSNVATWQLNVTYDTSKLDLVSGSTSMVRNDDGINNVSTTAGTLTFKAKAEGSAFITVGGNAYNESDQSVNVASSTNVNIKAVAVAAPATPASAPAPTPAPTQTQVSSNANLKNLYVNVEGMTPAFNKTRLNYALNVEESVSSLTVTAVPEDSKATFRISGNTELKHGENVVTVTVTAPDKKTTKTYKVTVNRSDNPELRDANLSNIIIENATMTSEFDTNVYEYMCEEIEGNIDSLVIMAFPNNKEAKIEIIGNENLEVGENIIKIIVTSKNGENTKEYIITVNKKEIIKEVMIYEDEEVLSLKELDEPKIGGFVSNIWNNFKRHWLVLTLLLVCILQLTQIIYLYNKVKRLSNNEIIEDEDTNEEIETISEENQNTSEEETSWLKPKKRRRAGKKNNEEYTSEEVNYISEEIEYTENEETNNSEAEVAKLLFNENTEEDSYSDEITEGEINSNETTENENLEYNENIKEDVNEEKE